MISLLTQRFWSYVERRAAAECWPWIGARRKDGYGVIGAGGRGAGLWRAHRLAWTIHHGAIPRGLFVCHRCDNPPCCNPWHLFLGSPGDNHRDMRAKHREENPPRLFGDRNPSRIRPPRGELNGAAKVTREQAAEIRRIYTPGDGQMLAKHYGVSRSAINRIARGATWI